MHTLNKTGVFWSFASAFLWSTTFISSRWLMKAGSIDSISLSLMRFLIGGLILLVLGCLFFRNRIFGVSPKDFLKLALLGLFGVAGMSVFLFMGQRSTTAINSSMIMQINPIMILIGGLFIGERAGVLQMAGIAVSLLGCLMVVDVISPGGFAYSPEHLRGDGLILLSAACWATYSILGKDVVKRVGGYAATLWAMIFGALELILIALLISLSGMDYEYTFPTAAPQWYVIAYLGVFPTALAFFAWYEAMDKIDIQLLNVMQYLTPVFTIFLAYLLLDEKMSPFNILGAVLVLAGVMLTAGIFKRARTT